MTITFYKMNGCGFCTKAEDLLKDEIESGVIVVKDKSQAPSGVRGFPHFVNEINGKTHTGYPQTADNLYKVLEFTKVDVAENFADKMKMRTKKILSGATKERYGPSRNFRNTEPRALRLPPGQRAPQPKMEPPVSSDEGPNSGFELNWHVGVF